MSNESSFPDLLKRITELDRMDASDPKARTRARLLRVATKLFAEQGYRRTSIDDVAREAHLAKGTVYLYFKNKQELLFQAVLEEKKRYAAVFAPLFKDDVKPEHRLRRYLELAMTSLRSMPLVSKLLGGDRELFEFLEDLGGPLKDQIEEGQHRAMAMLLKGVGKFDRLDKEEKAARIQALVGLTYAMPAFMEERFHGDLSPERYAQAIAQLIVNGVGSP